MRIEKFLESTPLFALYATHEKVMGDVQRRLREERVHFLQALILTGIFFEERAVRPSELAVTLKSEPSKISHALRGLEREGWIARDVVPTDARAYTFSLTRDGRRKVPRLIKFFDSIQEQIEAAPGGRRLRPTLELFAIIYGELK